MKMYEVLHVGTYNKYVTDDELKRAQEVYDHYVAYWDENGCDRSRMRSPAQFLLEDVDYDHLDSFLWDKGRLVRTQDGKIGMTVGWARVRCGSSHFAVLVKTSDGVKSYLAGALERPMSRRRSWST